jgi:hypothetical protein
MAEGPYEERLLSHRAVNRFARAVSSDLLRNLSKAITLASSTRAIAGRPKAKTKG